MSKRWRAPKGVGVVYKGKGFRKKANPGQRSSDGDEGDEESGDEESDDEE